MWRSGSAGGSALAAVALASASCLLWRRTDWTSSGGARNVASVPHLCAREKGFVQAGCSRQSAVPGGSIHGKIQLSECLFLLHPRAFLHLSTWTGHASKG